MLAISYVMCKDVSDKVCDNLHVMYETCLTV